MRTPRQSLAAGLLAVAGALCIALGAGPARALSSAVSLEITDLYADTFGTGLTVGSSFPLEFTAHGCSEGDTACMDYFGADPVTGGYYFDFGFLARVDLGTAVVLGSREGLLDYGDTTVQNAAPGSGSDSFTFSAATEYAVLEPDEPGDPGAIAGVLQLHLSFTDTDGTALSHGGVPDSLPPVPEFESTSFYVEASHSGQTFQAAGIVHALPEPSSLALLASGLVFAALASGRARRHR